MIGGNLIGGQNCTFSLNLESEIQIYNVILTTFRDVHGEKPYSCDHCDVRFRSGYDKKTHMEAVHDKEVPQGCPICAKTFHKKSYVARHIKEVHEKERPFSCDQCGMKCSSRLVG